ncbi:hypothetical protein BKD09_44515 [Bradyrhizobium japonicum]|uniref:Uncharacterized protein n=1 Tax=Bradyrhizobium japonicum TaxID=375 RepID=A0A1L3FPZ8_BRAJP|nr:hypothetical protein BKD09_44515 [Bradyrhizobium japonicum]
MRRSRNVGTTAPQVKQISIEAGSVAGDLQPYPAPAGIKPIAQPGPGCAMNVSIPADPIRVGIKKLGKVTI